MGYIDTAVSWAVQIANDDSYKYIWGGWGKADGGYDCGHFVIDAYTKAGINVKGAGATYTGDMPKAFMSCGFQNVTSQVNLSTGAGMLKGDVLVNTVKHAALVQRDGGITVEAWCSKGGIVADKAYRNDGWDYVLRYPESRTSASTLNPQNETVVETYMYSENSYEDGEKGSTVVWNNRVKENVHKLLQNLLPIEPQDKLTLFANETDITEMAGNLSWKNSIYELATTMSFETAKTDAAYLKNTIYVPQVGDIIRMVTNTEIFRGVITKVDDGDRNVNKYTIVDLGWYLNKTTQTYQFKNITAADAIKELCADLVIEIVMLPELNTNINKIYFDQTISAILTDILSQCGGDYNYDFVPEGLRIYKVGDLVAYPEFRVASNIAQVFSPDYKGNMSHSTSIEEMFNSIKVTSEKDNVYTELMVLQNRELIDKYGFLQKVMKIDPEKENADTVAQTHLAEYGKLKESFSFEIIEKYDSYTRAGEVIDLDGVRYVIESTDHRFEDGWHYDKLGLKKIV